MKCTASAQPKPFVTPLTLHTISRHPVFSSFEDEKADWVPPHIQLAQQADLLLIAPATANAMANFAHGLAPDMLSSLYLACQSPVLICPAMNVHMWEHAATQQNAAVLKQRKNHHIFGPSESGILACGAEGAGKLMPVDRIVQKTLSLLP